MTDIPSMITELTTVKDKDGWNYNPAQVAKCSVCNGDSFHIFIVDGCNHLQCVNPGCNETYCQGECDKPNIRSCACGEEH